MLFRIEGIEDFSGPGISGPRTRTTSAASLSRIEEMHFIREVLYKISEFKARTGNSPKSVAIGEYIQKVQHTGILKRLLNVAEIEVLDLPVEPDVIRFFCKEFKRCSDES